MNTERIELALERAQQREPGAADELLELADESAQRAARRLLPGFPLVAAQYDTGDVRQLALMRMGKAFDDVDVRDAAHFHRLVATHVRRALLGLKRRLASPSRAAEHETRFPDPDDPEALVFEPKDETHDPRRLAEWLEIHAAIEALPARDREMFDLLWYAELSQEEAAKALRLSVRQVGRRWTAAKLRLRMAIPEAFER